MSTVQAPADTRCPVTGKKQYTRERAEALLPELRRKVNPALVAYQCPEKGCGAWHHGKSRERFNKHLKKVLQVGRSKHEHVQARRRR